MEYLERGGPLTDGSRRSKLRRELRVGKFTKEMVDEFARQQQHQRQREIARRPRPQRGQTFQFNGEKRTLTEIMSQRPDIRRAYEARGVRAPLAQRNRLRKDLLEGRDPLAVSPPRQQRPPTSSFITINGERLTARQALERYPQLRGYLQPERRLTERTLHAKLRREFRNGRIPDHVINEEPPTFFRVESHYNGAEIRYKLDDSRIKFHDIVSLFEYLKPQILRLIEDQPNTKVSLNVHVLMVRRTTGAVEKKGLF